jgi:hypothetical protein
MNVVGSGPQSLPSGAVTPFGGLASLTLQDGGGTSGKPEHTDQIIITYPTAINPALLCSSWTAISQPVLRGPNVVVTARQGISGNDTIESVAASNCAGGFHFGSIDLGQTGYFNNDVTFGGFSLLSCDGLLASSGCTTIQWSGTNTLTITLGAPSPGSRKVDPSVITVYTPDPALGISGTISSANVRQF